MTNWCVQNYKLPKKEPTEYEIIDLDNYSSHYQDSDRKLDLDAIKELLNRKPPRYCIPPRNEQRIIHPILDIEPEFQEIDDIKSIVVKFRPYIHSYIKQIDFKCNEITQKRMPELNSTESLLISKKLQLLEMGKKIDLFFEIDIDLEFPPLSREIVKAIVVDERDGEFEP
ncbi:MAG: hypothetical protein ACTSRU_10020 [Candidatus Hodarchaeales archaeon]